MTRGQWIAGCLVVLAATAGGWLSVPWTERSFPRRETIRTNNADAGHKRTCISIGGKRFEWNFPNPPFGTLSCSE
jgi:hypothetical protein